MTQPDSLLPNSASTVSLRTTNARTAVTTVLALACLLAWDFSGLDMPMAQWFGARKGFALQNNGFMVNIAHEGARKLAWAVILCLSLMIWWPKGWMRNIPVARRKQLVIGAFIALIVVTLMKRISASSCPWDLAEFGGVGHYVSHWVWGVKDGGGGHCFPAGHASASFAFISGYFALRHNAPRAARWWLFAALLAGFALGLAQQMRGAHFMSHTLWTAWLCWTTCWLYDLLTTYRINKRTEPSSTLPPTQLASLD